MDKVLVSWVARSNDPYEWDAKNGKRAVDNDGNDIEGPTLALLFHQDSFLCNQITDVILFCRKPAIKPKPGERTDAVVAEELKTAIKKKTGNNITVHKAIPWISNDPTDHEGLFRFLKEKLPDLRVRFPLAEMYLHLSPGTPQMHAIMLLMATSGFVLPALKMVKTYRLSDGKKGIERFKEVQLDISPFYQAYRNSRPHLASTIVLGENLMPDDFHKDGPMQACYLEASKIAHSKCPVLITGDTGTGKYALASWIRLKSTSYKEENNNSWPSVSCAAHNSFESFSQVLRGDQSKGYQGILAKADGDTILLDEIDFLLPQAQSLLVQLLDRSSFRLIATSTLSAKEVLERLIDPLRRRFVSPILELPPLRKMGDDIGVFWRAIFRDTVSTYIEEHQQEKVLSWGNLYGAGIVNMLKKKAEFLSGNLHDLKKIAVNIATAVSISDYHKDAKNIYENAICEYYSTKPELTAHDICKSLALAFAKREHLDDHLPIAELVAKDALKIKWFDRELKKFVAKEITRLAIVLKCSKENICDLDRKTINDWSKLNRGKTS